VDTCIRDRRLRIWIYPWISTEYLWTLIWMDVKMSHPPQACTFFASVCLTHLCWTNVAVVVCCYRPIVKNCSCGLHFCSRQYVLLVASAILTRSENYTFRLRRPYCRSRSCNVIRYQAKFYIGLREFLLVNHYHNTNLHPMAHSWLITFLQSTLNKGREHEWSDFQHVRAELPVFTDGVNRALGLG